MQKLRLVLPIPMDRCPKCAGKLVNERGTICCWNCGKVVAEPADPQERNRVWDANS